LSLKKRKSVISIIPYLNAKPLTYFLEVAKGKEYSIEYNLPSECVARLEKGEVDAGIVSSLAMALIPDCNVVDGICIASNSSVESVLLFSKYEIEDINTIFLDPASATSNALIKVLMEKWFKKKCNYKKRRATIDELLKIKKAGVLAIGDRSLRFGMENPSLIKMDLALEWSHFTGLPFVFAMWLVKKNSSLSPELFRNAAKKGIRHIDLIIKDYIERTTLKREEKNEFTSVILKNYQLKRYLKENLHYIFGSKERKGLMLFLKLCAELNIIPFVPEINFV